MNKGNQHMNDLPWDLNPDLQKERILKLGNLFTKVRGEVIDLHDEELGDTRLSLGVRAYECCRTRIIQQVKQGDWVWLSILTPNKRFTFSIGDTPVRFVRNDPEELPSDKLIRSDEASQQLELFEKSVQHSNLHWFFVIDTYYKNVADSMYFVGYDECGKIICQWKVPLEDTGTLLSEVSKDAPQAVELKKAPIKVKAVEEKTISKDE